ncbi:unnamed protein product [Eruca vesicaria subsp. sativa]|uniref:Uncharacterized protein n=1 Tax=Eruca vesicaria subsp. sativa TaxID=29727 RepID=A0ABC8LK43_ERUVS|nr:unnamed protein product [Eruca vesicaria subsp. sativa]
MVRLEHFLQRIMTDDDNTYSQLDATISLRKLVTKHPLLEDITRPDIVSRFNQFLAYDDFPQLKHEAARMLATMTTENVQVLVGCGTVPLLVKLINADAEEDRLLAVRALRNIAAKSIECSDHVLSCGALMPLLSLCEVPNQTTTMLRDATRTLTILCCLRPCPPLAQIQPALPVLERFLQSENYDLLFLSSSLLATFFAEGENDETRQALIDLEVIPLLMELFKHESAKIHREVIRTILAVLSCGNRDHSQLVIDQIPIPSIASYLTKAEDTQAKTVASYIVYNVAWWDQYQLEQVIASGVVQNMIPLLQDHDPRLVIFCVGTIYRVTIGRNREHISLLVSQGCIEALCDTLTSLDQRIIQFSLSALEDILGVGRDEENQGNLERGGGSRYARRILNAGGLEKINALKANQDKHVKEKAMYIMANYFNEDKKWW